MLEIRPATDEDRSLADHYRAALARTLELLGVPKLVVLRIQQWPAYAVRFRLEQLFVQTPGPAAGQAFQGPFRAPEPVRT